MDWMNAANPIGKHLSQASFTVPEYLCETAWADHAPFGFWLIEALRPRTLVELGTHGGYSYFAFCQAVKTSELNTKCYAVDHWRGDEHAGFYDEAFFENVLQYNETHYAAFSRLIRSSFDQALPHFSDGTIDLLHIDGRHFYDDVKHDFESWRSKLSHRAVILFHDINVRERDFGVFRLWEELRDQYPHFEFVHGHGLGVLGFGKALPEAMMSLFAADQDPEEMRAVRQAYARLGGALKSEIAASQALAKIRKLTRKVDAAHKALVEKTAEVKVLIDKATELQAEADRVSVLLAELDRLRKKQNDEISELNAVLEVSAADILALKTAQQTHLEIIYQYRHLSPKLLASWLRRRLHLWAVAMYLAIPISVQTKRSIRDVVFRIAGPLLRKWPIYQKWQRSYWRLRRMQAVHKATGQRIKALREVARPLDIDYSAAVPFAYGPAAPTTPPRLAVICHLYYEHMALEFRRYLRNIPAPFDVYISTDTETKKAAIEKCFSAWTSGKVDVRITPNQGRDIAPKLLGFRDVYGTCDYVLYLHSKASEHANILECWRGSLLENLIGSPAIVASVLDAFSRTPDLGIVASQHFEPARRFINWGNDFKIANQLARRMGIDLARDRVLDFPSGSMFWARAAALRPLTDLELSFDDFGPERGQIDGTMAHAIERLYYYICERAGYRWIKIAVPDLFDHTPAIQPIDSPNSLARFMSERTIALTGPNLPAPRLAHLPAVDPSPRLFTRLQEHALGCHQVIDAAMNVSVGIVTYNNSDQQLRRIVNTARRGLERAGLATAGRILVLENGTPSPYFAEADRAIVRLPSAGNVGFAAGQNRLMAEAFSRGAEIFIAANPDGAFHPDAIAALVQMMLAQDGDALIEALQFPSEHPKPYDRVMFETNWASGACLAIPRAAYDALRGFDETFFMYCEDVDLSWRARANGFAVRTCPRALFLHAVTNRVPDPAAQRMMYDSGIILARKWGNAAFENAVRRHLRDLGFPPPALHPELVPTDWRLVPDFDNQFTFARARW